MVFTGGLGVARVGGDRSVVVCGEGGVKEGGNPVVLEGVEVGEGGGEGVGHFVSVPLIGSYWVAY